MTLIDARCCPSSGRSRWHRRTSEFDPGCVKTTFLAAETDYWFMKLASAATMIHPRHLPDSIVARKVSASAFLHSLDPQPTFPGHHLPPCQGLCQTVVPSTQYDPQSHKNGKSAQKPDNSRHLFKYIHRSFLLFIFDSGQRRMATPLLITVTDQSTFFVNPIQQSHTLVARPINRAAATIQLKRPGGRTLSIPEG